MQKRNRRSRFFALFDGADPNASTPLRDVTTVPTQALYFMNDPFVHAAGRKVRGARPCVRRRMMTNGSSFAFRTLFGRQATDEERADATAFLAPSTRPGSTKQIKGAVPSCAWAAYARVLLASNEFLFVD